MFLPDPDFGLLLEGKIRIWSDLDPDPGKLHQDPKPCSPVWSLLLKRVFFGESCYVIKMFVSIFFLFQGGYICSRRIDSPSTTFFSEKKLFILKYMDKVF